MLAVAQMYIKGVSTREVEAVMREFGIESLSSSQVSRAAKLLDDELEAWRNRPLGEIRYMILDARYEKMRHGGVVRDAAVLSAIGIGPDERRRVLGVSVALSEAEVHWRAFLESLQARGLRGVEYVVSDDHAGLRAARRAVLGGTTWQRCRVFHLARTPSIMRRALRSASASAPSCAPSGTQPRWRRPRPPSPNWSRPTSAAHRTSRPGWRRA
jgi:transposase-like protein